MDSLQISLCDLPWWAVLASWLLPALLGYFWGILQYGRYKNKAKKAEKELSSASKRIVNLENEVSECRKAYEKVSREKDKLTQPPAPGQVHVPGQDHTGSPASVENITTTEIIHATRNIFGYSIRRNDLKIVDGIDPKIEKLLHEIGIYTWADLESVDLQYLSNVLREAGYTQLNVESWAYESALARQEKWDELKTFQERDKS